MTTDSEKLKIHFGYCCLILVLCLIAVATDRWTQQQKFTEYLSNAATMTSLLLGLVAIFYSFVSNDGLSRSLGNIDNVAKDISTTRDKIADYVGMTTAATEATRQSRDEMQRLSGKIGSDLSGLNNALREINSQSELLKDAIAALPTRIDKLESNVIDATRAVGEKIQPPGPSRSPAAIDATVVQRFLELSPLSGNLLAVACTLAAKTSRPLVIANVTAILEEKIDAYLSGFLACMDASQMVDRDSIKDKFRNFTINSVHPVLEERSRTYFTDYLERVYKDKPEVKANWLARLSKIEALYT